MYNDKITLSGLNRFLKLVHTEYQVNNKTQPFWVKVAYLVPNVQTLTGHDVGTIRLAATTTLFFDRVQKTEYSVSQRISYFILNRFFDILSFYTLGTTSELFWHQHSCSDKLPLTPHHLQLVFSNLHFAKNKKNQCEIKDLVFSTVLKWRVVVGAKPMVPTRV